MTRRPSFPPPDQLTVKARVPVRVGLRDPEMRLRLIDAGGQVIGQYGYAGCTITRVTGIARIAHGTFYLHFALRQTFFDTLLPTLGARLLKTVGRAVVDCRDLLELERHSLAASYRYLDRHPYLVRVLVEAKQFARIAFAAWSERVVSGYVRALRRCAGTRPLATESDVALEALATMLLGARSHLLIRYAAGMETMIPLGEAQVEAYLALVGPRLLGDAPG